MCLCLWRAASTGAPGYRRFSQRTRSISLRSPRNVCCLDRSQAINGGSGPVALTDQVPPSGQIFSDTPYAIAGSQCGVEREQGPRLHARREP
jgi:hypothetical protein